MYFKHYAPITKSEVCAIARAVRTYNAVASFRGEEKPDGLDYIMYRLEITNHPLDGNELLKEWKEIEKLVAKVGQREFLRTQNVVYFAILENGVKCGETNDIVQRYSNINKETPIVRMWYLPVDSKEKGRIAEYALHQIFDHARGMERQRNKKDYYNCDVEYAKRFISNHGKKMYDAIIAAILDNEE